ncbi:MAG: globin [Armatimonas sp.]
MQDISEVWATLGEGQEDAIRELVARFYEGIPSDPYLGPMYPKEDMAGAQERLTLFLIQRFGGPATYSEQRGHPRLRMRHGEFAVTPAARDAWIARMEAALEATPALESVRTELSQFFEEVAIFLQNRR